MQVIAWILGEYASQMSDKEKVLKILNLLSTFVYGTFEHERTRASILLAITRLHAALDFVKNEYLERIMNDFLGSRVVEAQMRAFDWVVLRKNRSNVNVRSLIFRTPITESQLAEEKFDFSFSFLDDFVEKQHKAGKPLYDESKC